MNDYDKGEEIRAYFAAGENPVTGEERLIKMAVHTLYENPQEGDLLMKPQQRKGGTSY